MHVILAAVLPVLLVTLIGYGIAKANQPFDSKTITFLVGTIGTPALAFTSLAHTSVAPETLAVMAGAGVAAIGCYLVIGALVLKASGLSLRTFLPSMSFPNSGNLGLPLALYAFGQEGLDYAVVIFALVSIGNHTIGRTIIAGRGNWRAAMTSPILFAVALGVTCATAGVVLPIWLDNTLALFAGLTIPLMLLMLGTSLATIPVTAFPRAVALSFLRIGLGVAVGFTLAGLFGFAGAARGAFVLQCAMPVAVYNYVYAKMYDHEADQVASLVVVSTVLSVITTPFLLAVLVE